MDLKSEKYVLITFISDTLLGLILRLSSGFIWDQFITIFNTNGLY